MYLLDSMGDVRQPRAPRGSWSVLLLGVLAGSLASQIRAIGTSGVSKSGGAGHALLFRDHVVLKTDFKDFPTTAMTFEAWISSSDFCHAGTILSYAKNSQSTDEAERVKDFNHFVIFDPRNLLACHDYQYIDLYPDPTNSSCHAAYKMSKTAPHLATAVERDGSWHHLAVTWDAKADGLMNVYMDGLLMSSAVTQKTEPLVPDGAFMLGGEQDCFGGCTDPNQGFNGLLDEVRLWKVARTQPEILQTMRWMDGLVGHPELVAWWQFNEPDTDGGMFATHRQALDSSGRGNHLQLIHPPIPRPANIPMPAAVPTPSAALMTDALQFRNNFAMSKTVKNMPGGSFTVEMWARGAKVMDDDSTQPRSANLFSYATQKVTAGGSPTGFMDDALRIERVIRDVIPAWLEPFFATSTAGAVALHINSNEHTDAEDTRSWIYFDTQWLDDGWHHIAASWDQGTGTASLLFDGVAMTPFWKSDWGVRETTSVAAGGVDPTLSPNSKRGTEGALVLGQDQDCFGGCFSSSDSFFGELAVVRVWRRVVGAEEVKKNMPKTRPESTNDMAALYVFDAAGIKPAEGGGSLAIDRSGVGNHLALRSSSPLYVYSTAPLSLTDGRPVTPPVPGAGGYSLALHDKQVLLLTDFHDFPSTELTLEFWMWSVDTCRSGVPFSYAAGEYERRDNAFLLFNYNSWGVSVMEDEGLLGDHQSGVSATDGNWHHIAVTWQSSTGKVVLYDNARPMWTVTRSKGKTIPSGGTLVIGREQDCPGGCFDSAAGAAGRSSTVRDQEYGPQDFFGVIEELRLWKRVRTPEQIRQSMAADDGRGPGGFKSPGVDPGHPDLVMYFKFDEGQGYRVRDVTGHGHDLSITQPPRWEVTRWLSTCGNAVVEGLEECDDGDLTDGDGCSASCTVEPGWVCPGSPSVCTRKGSPAPDQPTPNPQPHPDVVPKGGDSSPPDPEVPPTDTPTADGGGGGAVGPQTDGGRRTSKGKMAGIVIGSLMAAASVMALAALAFVHRARIYKESASLCDSLLAVVPGSSRSRIRQGYSRGFSYDPMEDNAPYAAPDFMSMAPAPSTQRVSAPGSAGPYQSLVGSPNTHGQQSNGRGTEV